MKHLLALQGPGTPPAYWREAYERDAREAAPAQINTGFGQSTSYYPSGSDGGQAARLREFGAWLFVTLDTFLVFVAELLLNVILAAAALFVLVLDGHYLGHGASVDTALSHATSALTDWLTTPVGIACSALATQGAIVLVLQMRVINRGLLTWRDLGWSREVLAGGTAAAPLRWPRALLIGVGLGLLAFVAGEMLLVAMHAAGLDVGGQERSLQSAKHAAALQFIPFAITTGLTAPLIEETFFRAYALRALAVRYGLPVALIVSSALFAALHLAGGVGWVVVPLFAVGAILGWGYARTGNLLTNVTAHAINNLIGLILLYAS